MEIKRLEVNEIKSVYGLLQKAFPAAELRKLEDIERSVKAGWGVVYATYEWGDVVHNEGEPAGVCTLMLADPGWAFMDYLAVDERLRCKGLGRVFMDGVLKKICGDAGVRVDDTDRGGVREISNEDRCDGEGLDNGYGSGIGCRVFIEVERPEDAPDKVMAQRRIGFYERYGFKMTPVCSQLMGVNYHIMVCSGGAFESTEVVPEELANEYCGIYIRLYPDYGSYEKFAKLWIE